MQTFKVLTLNMHKGFSAGNRRFTLEQIRSNLRATRSNIVFLQEVIGENEKHRQKISEWPDNNQFEFLADSVWDHYAYGKNAIYEHGHHGNAILSELPFVRYDNIDLSKLSFSQRGLLHGELENGVHLLCVHLGLLEAERRQQVAMVSDYIEQKIPAGAPLILAGDFNDWWRRAHRSLKQRCGLIEASEHVNERLALTFPAVLPMLPMDRIYLRGFRVDSIEVLADSIWRQVSDHCAVQAELSLAVDHNGSDLA